MAMTRASGVLGDRSVLNSEPASASARVTGVFWVLTHALPRVAARCRRPRLGSRARDGS